ncbi:MAG: HAD-IIA family hydrolase [Myxococcales bacterium]|nr:HAD-IIA family hydrolase [Myxococcales bacterium]
MSASPVDLDFRSLTEKHEALLFDAYGVLVDGHGGLDGAGAAIAMLEQARRPYLVVTNDASRSADTASKRFRSFGIEIAPSRVLSSGMLIGPYFQKHGLSGGRCVVLGTGDSSLYVREAGGEVIANEPDVILETTIDALVLCDERGFDFLATMDAVLTNLLRAFEAGRSVAMVVANPDLVYPSKDGRFAFTAGTLATMLEHALALRLGPTAPRFDVLGKPSRSIFDEACSRVETRDCVMLGDQLHTDVAGANDAGLASALVLTGVTSRATLARSTVQPTYVIERVG